MSIIFLLFAALIAAGCLMALVNWRHACLLLIFIGMLQDPVRKFLPGTPAFLVLSTAPVWAAIIATVLIKNQQIWNRFKRNYQSLTSAIIWLFICLIPAALISATYSPGSWKITILGMVGVVLLPMGLLAGYQFPTPQNSIISFIKFYCLIAAVLAIGGPLEYAGLEGSIPSLGTTMMDMDWIRYSNVAEDAKLIAGFFRSPDIYGYHAAMLTMLGFILALMSRGYSRLWWIALSGCGIIGVMLCGRRKMFMMLPVFLLVLLWLNFCSKRNKKTDFRVIVLVLAGCIMIGLFLYNYIGPSATVEHHYFYTLEEIPERGIFVPYQSLRTTYLQNGFWGAGLGMASLGAHHIPVTRPHIWQEDGLGRMLVEFGVPGFIAFIIFSIVLFRTIFRITKATDSLPQQRSLYEGLTAVIFANAASFIVSHQVFGDIFIGCIVSLLIGFMFSAARLLPPGALNKKALSTAPSRRPHPPYSGRPSYEPPSND